MHNTTHLEPDSRESHLLPVREFLKRVPYWLVTAIILGLIFVWIILTNADYATIFAAVKKGQREKVAHQRGQAGISKVDER